MNLSELKSAEGSRQNNWRKGRGHGSGNGKTAGRGHKGQGARSGSGGKAGFEGGNSKEIVTVNVGLLNERFENDAVIDIDALKAVGLISNPRDGVKILGVGELDKKLTIKVQQFSKSAVEKIEAAGGKAEVI